MNSQSSWYLSIRQYFEDLKIPIFIDYRGEFHEFIYPTHDFRRVTLRRSRRSFTFEEEINAENPPMVWALWSDCLTPKMQGYFEEISNFPTPNQLTFMAEIISDWLINFVDIKKIELKAGNRHSKFFLQLPAYRQNKKKLITQTSLTEEEAELRAINRRWRCRGL